MTDLLQRLYGTAPYPLKVAMASARGARLDRDRYGPETEELVASALKREMWGEHEWAPWTGERLAAVLASAAAAPWYHGLTPATPLAEWPILTKSALRGHEAELIRPDLTKTKLVEDHTSGTTGTPLTLRFTKRAVRGWYALFEARIRRWNGVDRNARWAIVGGQLVTPAARRTPPYWVWNAASRQLYLSSFHIGAESARVYAGALERHRVRYLLGYPSAMAALARALDTAGVQPMPLAVVLSNAEPLLSEQRELIGRVFDCPVRDTYGLSESVAGASECEAGMLHLWPDAGVVEIVDDDGRPVPAGEVGRIVSTGLLNHAMPLVRYDTGDLGSLAPNVRCACGRTLPVLAEVTGRQDDVLVTPDGRRVGRLDGVFKADLPIIEAQIVQWSAEDVLVRVVAAPGWASTHGDDVVSRLHDRLGEMHISVQLVDAIPRTSNGKFRAVISELP